MAKKKLNVPTRLQGLEQITSMDEFLDRFNLNGFAYIYNYVQFRKCDTFNFEAIGRKHDPFCYEATDYNVGSEDMLMLQPYGFHTVMFVDDDLNPWEFELLFIEADEIREILQNSWKEVVPQKIHSPKIQIKGIKPVRKLMANFSNLQSNREILNLIRRKNPYAAAFVESVNIEPVFYCMAPQIEQLYKMGIAFIEKMIHEEFSLAPRRKRLSKSEINAFNRLTQRGTSPKTIFKTSKVVYNGMKDVSDLLAWDAVRKMAKNGKINADTIRMMVNTGYNVRDLTMVNLILSKTYRGQAIFTMDSLINYLNRIDMNEAIDRNEGLQILLDYLRCCETLNVEPRIDGDSLKREHDVMARNVRQHRDQVMAEKMTAACEELQKYNYSESVFFARAIASYDDLIDEANQQHNCVATYASLIANGKTMIFVVRMTANPGKSFITLELDPATLRIRQKYVAYNQPVRNRSASEFLLRFQKHCMRISDERMD